MRTLLTAVAFGAALAVLPMTNASAQQNGNYCLSTGGEMNCSFATMAQCQAAMTGSITESCVRNPNSDSGIPGAALITATASGGTNRWPPPPCRAPAAMLPSASVRGRA